MPNDADHDIVREVLDGMASAQHLLLPALLAIQHRVGYVPKKSLALIAQHFNLSLADVHGVTSFYHDLRAEPAARHFVQICQAEACQAVGCRTLAKHAEARLGVAMGASAPDARVRLEAAYCFGNCACGPTVRIGDEIFGRVTPDRFDELVAQLPGARP